MILRLYVVIMISSLCLTHGVFLGTSFAESESEQYQKYNLDEKKFEFVRDYLNGLMYIKENIARREKITPVSLFDFTDVKKISSYVDHLIWDNINLRIARNYLKKHLNSKNGLILKSGLVFTNACNTHIDLNNREKDILEQIYKTQVKGTLKDAQKEQFADELKRLSAARKEASKELLEASVLVSKILISNQTDKFGEFFMLGISSAERERLIKKLNAFVGKKYVGEIREGQSVLEASIAVIRGILEDMSWQTVDG